MGALCVAWIHAGQQAAILTGALTLYLDASFIISGVADLIELDKSGSVRMILGWIVAGAVMLVETQDRIAGMPAPGNCHDLPSPVGDPAKEKVPSAVMNEGDLSLLTYDVVWLTSVPSGGCDGPTRCPRQP